MNRIKQLFGNKTEHILSVYFTAGFPKLEDTTDIIRELQNQGIDMIEIGIPFSDPMADGPVIQASGTVALQNGMSLKKLFSQLDGIRKDVHIPLILMGYLNSFMQYGFENCCQDAVKSGIDGMIIPDLPFKIYLEEYKPIADKCNLKIIMLITPETSEERVRLIDKHTDGFIYMVSSASTTGVQQNFDEKKQSYFRRISAMQLKNPRLIGFGISNGATLKAAWKDAAGAIIGSKFVQSLKSESSIKNAVTTLLDELKKE